MRTHKRIIALAALAMSLAACSDINPSSSGDVVRISANIKPLVQTKVADAGDKFESGDKIKVTNKSRTTNNVAVYTAAVSGETTTWSTSDVLLWSGSGDNTFQAVHPATASYESFTIPDNQVTGLDEADWLTAEFTGAKAADASSEVSLDFTHRLAKITVNIAKWTSEISEDLRSLSSAQIRTLSTEASWDGEALKGNGQSKWIKAFLGEESDSFSAIIAPGTYASGADILRVSINQDRQSFSVKLKEGLTLKAGEHYVLSLTVGRDVLGIGSISINPWLERTIDATANETDEN
ncbi:MAG: fimbrillin family protein [Bacteroidales bacterium]|nr:fimbrillin family protein [Bacteroidales bacterium]